MPDISLRSANIDSAFGGFSPLCSPLPGKAIKQLFSPSLELCLQDSIWYLFTEAEFQQQGDNQPPTVGNFIEYV